MAIVRALFLQCWDRGERLLSQLFLFAATALIIMEVVGRYFLHFSIFWVEEYTRYLIIGAVMTGASTLIRTDGHVAVTILQNKVSPQRKAILNFLHSGLGVFVSLVILKGGVGLVSEAWSGGFESETLARTPLWIPYLLIILGGSLMAASWIWKVFQMENFSWQSLKDPFTYLILALTVVGIWIFYGIKNAVLVPVIGLLLFVALGLPIAFALGLTTILAVFGFDIGPSIVIASKGFWQMNSFTLLAIPFFILAAEAMIISSLGNDVFEFATASIGHIRGGLGIAMCMAAAMFDAMSGSTVANAAALGTLGFPLLVSRGYPPRLAVGLLGAGGTLAPMIPPSTHMVMYGAITQQSVGDLLIAGIIPGLVMAASFAVYTYIASLWGGYGKVESSFSLKRFLKAGRKCVWAALMPLIIVGVIYLGIASPTEAAAISALYGFAVTGLVYRELKVPVARQMFQETINITAMIFLIIMFSGVFGFVLAEQQFPQFFTEAVVGAGINGWQFMLIAIGLIFILGFFMGTAAITLVVIPMLVPLLKAYHFNLIQFGVISAAVLETSFLTPPVGSVLYIMARVCKMKLEEVIRGVWPFVVVILIITLLFAFVPEISLILIKGR
ncbi:MAG: TRAP transporter large permease subunit [Thermodesulfobacteriota bacterium]